MHALAALTSGCGEFIVKYYILYSFESDGDQRKKERKKEEKWHHYICHGQAIEHQKESLGSKIDKVMIVTKGIPLKSSNSVAPINMRKY